MHSDTVILLTESAALAMGLRALLLSIPPIQTVECLVDADSLLERLETDHPALVVLDTCLLSARADEVLRSIRLLSPTSQRVIFADDMSEYRKSDFGQAEVVIIKGADPAWLAHIFEELLRENSAA
jgi:DNA-binding NarL/FixJ family response regulator